MRLEAAPKGSADDARRVPLASTGAAGRKRSVGAGSRAAPRGRRASDGLARIGDLSIATYVPVSDDDALCQIASSLSMQRRRTRPWPRGPARRERHLSGHLWAFAWLGGWMTLLGPAKGRTAGEF